MAKAYDKLEWSFIELVLRNFSFSEIFINLVIQCITTTQFSVLINGGPMGKFNASRGIRQGDPLSPFLFIICSKILSRLLLRGEMNKKIHGVKIG